MNTLQFAAPLEAVQLNVADCAVVIAVGVMLADGAEGSGCCTVTVAFTLPEHPLVLQARREKVWVAGVRVEVLSGILVTFPMLVHALTPAVRA